MSGSAVSSVPRWDKTPTQPSLVTCATRGVPRRSERQALPDQRPPRFPYRRIGHRRLLCLHEAKVGRREPDRQFPCRLQRDHPSTPWTSSTSSMRRCTGTATTSSRPGEDPFFSLPVFNDVGGAIRMFYIGWYIRDAQRHPQVPRLDRCPARSHGPHRVDLQRSRFLRRDGLRARRCPAARQRQDPALPRGLRGRRRSGRRRHLLRLWLTAHAFSSVDRGPARRNPRRRTRHRRR